MQLSERTSLIQNENVNGKTEKKDGLSLFLAIICIVDVFGVFPVVALPKAIIDCGLYGVFLVMLVSSIQMYTSILLGRCWIIAEKIDPSINSKSRYPYSALSEFAYGKKLGNFVTILVDITVFGGGIPNLIVASQNLQLLGLRLTNEDLNISFCFWIIVLGTILCPILWLGSPKDMKCLCSISVVIVFLVFILVNGSLMDTSGAKPSISDEVETKKTTWEYIFIAYGILTFQFDIHPNILTIHVDMKDKTKISKAILGGFFISLFMFAVTCINAYSMYGDDLKPSILETLSTTIFLHFASVLVSVQLCLTSAISNSALYQHMEEVLQISREFNQKRCILRTVLIILAIMIAESVPRFDIVMSLIGATLTSPLVYVLPPLIYLKVLKLQEEHEKQLAMESFTNSIYNDEENEIREIYTSDKDYLTRILASRNLPIHFFKKFLNIFICSFIIVTSFLCTVCATYLNVIDAMNFEDFSYPCIYNISTALFNSE